jgi:hypothetical protein
VPGRPARVGSARQQQAGVAHGELRKGGGGSRRGPKHTAHCTLSQAVASGAAAPGRLCKPGRPPRRCWRALCPEIGSSLPARRRDAGSPRRFVGGGAQRACLYRWLHLTGRRPQRAWRSRTSLLFCQPCCSPLRRPRRPQHSRGPPDGGGLGPPRRPVQLRGVAPAAVRLPHMHGSCLLLCIYCWPTVHLSGPLRTKGVRAATCRICAAVRAVMRAVMVARPLPLHMTGKW